MNIEELRRLVESDDWIVHQEQCEWRRNADGWSECTCGATTLIGALPALLRVAEAAREFEAASQDVDNAERDPRGHLVMNAAYHREHAALAALWAALRALEARR